MKSYVKKLTRGVLVPDGAEGAAGGRCDEPLLRVQVQLLVPVQNYFILHSKTSRIVLSPMFWWRCTSIGRATVRPLARHRAEEVHRPKVSFFVDVDASRLLVQLHVVLAHEKQVALVLVGHVGLDEVVEATLVVGVVVAFTSAADGVLDLDGVLLRVVDLFPGEDDLGAVLAGAVMVVEVVRDVAVRDSVGVDGMPTVPWKNVNIKK